MNQYLNVSTGQADEGRWSRLSARQAYRVTRMLVLWLGSLAGAPVLAQVSGTVFWDYDRNGLKTATEPVELGAAGMRLLAYVEGIPQPFTATTGPDGRFSFDADQIGTGKRVRLELTNPFRYAFDSPGTGSSVQFVQAPANGILLGLSDPASYCQTDPQLAVPIYQSGARRQGPGMVSFPATVLTIPPSDIVAPAQLASSARIGTVWGTAYQRQTQKLFALSVLKRHAALGPLGLGGIYWANGGDAAAYLDAGTLMTLASEADQEILATRSLPTSVSATSVDGAVFALVGKVGFGGGTFTPTEETLWVINLHEKTLVGLKLGLPNRPAAQLGAGDITAYAIPQVDTDKGINRPWAVTYYRDKLYVGVVNDASISRDRRDLKAYVYAFDLATGQFADTPLLTLALNYPKGWVLRGTDDAASMGNGWDYWSDNWTDYSTNFLSETSSPQLARVVRPQPILSSIAFDAEGSMVLGFMDRTGHQTGRNQPSPTETSNAPAMLYSGYSGGDMLRAALVGNAYVLEGNGSAGSRSGSGVGNKQGPADSMDSGEFYAWEQYNPSVPSAVINQETFTGSLLAVPTLTNLVASVYNPLATWSGGALLFDMYNGDLMRRYEVYRDELSTDPALPRSTFGSTNGLGMFCALCDVAPVSIGNRLWVDGDGNGVQDPNEAPLPGVWLSLYTADGQWLASTQTNEQGRYAFRSGPGLSLVPNATYLIGIGIDSARQQYNPAHQVLRVGNKAYKLTAWNQGVGENKAGNDSDGFMLMGSTTVLNGFPVMQFRLSVPGQVITDMDAGLQEVCDPTTSSCIPVSFRRMH